MQEIKQIILSRIRDIHQLEKSQLTQDLRYRQITKQKSIELQRNAQEIRLLVSLDSYIYDHHSIFAYILDIVHQICLHYDPDIKIQQDIDARLKLYKLLKLFFITHDYKEKISTLKAAFMKSAFVVSPSMIFTWLSEWSRKKYLQTLNLQVKSQKQRVSHVLIHQTETIQNDTNDQDTQYIRCSNNSHIIEKMRQSYNFTEGSDIRYSQKQITPKRKTQNAVQTIQSNPTERFKTISNIQVPSNIKHLTIYNRATLYGYIYDEMIQYYKLNDIMSLDINYIKLMRKKKLKELLFTKQNEKKSTEVLIQCSNNKGIKNVIKQYYDKYKAYKEQESKSMAKINNANQKLTESLTFSLRNKKTNLYLPIQDFRSGKNSRKNTEHQFKVDHQTNIKTEVYQNRYKFSSIQQQIKQRVSYRLKKAEIGCENFGMKLPTINKQNQKQQNVHQKKTKSNIQSTQQVQNQQIQNQQQLKNFPKFKFNQRQTIKGIIMKNFLSNRQKVGKNIQDQLQNDQKQQFLYIKSANKVKTSVDRIQKHEKPIQNTNIRSLRQKTNAILRNFRIVQNF